MTAVDNHHDNSLHTEQFATVWFPNGPESVARARAHVRSVLTGWDVDEDIVEDAALMTSELVTNVYRHTDSSSASVCVTAVGRQVYVTVREQLPSAPPQSAALPVGMPPHSARRGRGLAIVDALAHEWGIARAKHSTATWFCVVATRPLPLAALSPAAADQIETLQASLRRSQLLLRISEALTAAHDPVGVGRAVTRALRTHLGACFVGLALIDEDRERMGYLRLDPVTRAGYESSKWFDFGFDAQWPVGAAAIHGQPYFHGTRAAADVDFPGTGQEMAAAGVNSMVHLPLVVRGRSIGTLALAWEGERTIDADQRALLLIVAGYTAQAI